MLQDLSCLQHLDFESANAEDDLTEADVAGITAPGQLAHLNISELLFASDYRHMFPAGRVRPQLRSLSATMQLLLSHETMCALVRCCPGLEDIELLTGKQCCCTMHTMHAFPCSVSAETAPCCAAAIQNVTVVCVHSIDTLRRNAHCVSVPCTVSRAVSMQCNPGCCCCYLLTCRRYGRWRSRQPDLSEALR